MDKELLVKRLKELSEEKKITLTKAFIESGVGKNFISNMKTSNPSMGKITMLANYFNVSVDYLLGNTDKKVCMTFTETVRKLLSENKMSINRMLTDLKLGSGTFATWEKRGTIPSGETLEMIADYFNVSVDYLLGKAPEQSNDLSEYERELLGLLRQLSDDDLTTALKLVKLMAEKHKQ